MRIITKTWFNTLCSKFDRIVLVVFVFCCLTVYNIPFFVANLDSSLLESFNKFMIFFFILYDTYRILWKIKSCFFWFSMMKNIVASLFSSLSIILICCLKSGFSNSNSLKSIHNLINCQAYNYYFYSFQYLLLCFFIRTSKKLFAIN